MNNPKGNPEYMKLVKATMNDLETISCLYKRAGDPSRVNEYSRWCYGQHPTEELIKGFTKDGTMFYAMETERLVGAVAVTPKLPAPC